MREGDVLTIQPISGWNDIAASVTVRGEVEHPGTYGIKPGERLSSVLQRTGGFSAEASPYGAVLMRREVRELQMKAHLELIERMKDEELQLKSLPDGDEDQKNAKLNAIARTETTLQQLQATDPIGRVVVHVPANTKEWKGSATDVAMRDGDVLVIPKKANVVMVNGQVFNPTAVSYLPGRSAKWYSEPGGRIDAGGGQEGRLCDSCGRLRDFIEKQRSFVVVRRPVECSTETGRHDHDSGKGTEDWRLEPHKHIAGCSIGNFNRVGGGLFPPMTLRCIACGLFLVGLGGILGGVAVLAQVPTEERQKRSRGKERA